MLAGRALARVREEYPGLEVEEVDVVTQPLRAWRAGVRIIPAMRMRERMLSGVLLSESRIRAFLGRGPSSSKR